ncbi:MAG: hypothetical protein WBB86_04325, partial [Candidatus Omnitrophota bacterium]
YRYLRKNDLDYIEAHSVDEIIEALKNLRKDKDLYHSMIQNGLSRGKDFTFEKISGHWENFLKDTVFYAYEEWRKASRLKWKMLYMRGAIVFLMITVYRFLKKLLEHHLQNEKRI